MQIDNLQKLIFPNAVSKEGKTLKAFMLLVKFLVFTLLTKKGLYTRVVFQLLKEFSKALGTKDVSRNIQDF